MKPIQLILVGVAGLSALGAGALMMNLNSMPEPTKVIKTAKVSESKVLIAKVNIPLGTSLTAKNMKWESWPDKLIRKAYIVRDSKPDALEDLSTATARVSFFAGEPIREAKIVHADSGYMSAILPAGKRAMALRISTQRSAGGFILPNDKVDILMPISAKKVGLKSPIAVTKTILQNVRVLAVDQIVEEQSGEKTIIGRTVTLELTAEQAELVTSANYSSGGKLSLALRSVEDAQLRTMSPGMKREAVRTIKYGKQGSITPKK